MNWTRLAARWGLPRRQLFWRYTIALACPAGILWLGFVAIDHIEEMYGGLCPVTGQRFAALCYDNSPLCYCVGIGSELSLLGLIVLIAAIAVPGALGGWWYHVDNRARKRPD
jgi:hypothetical protein